MTSLNDLTIHRFDIVTKHIINEIVTKIKSLSITTKNEDVSQ